MISLKISDLKFLPAKRGFLPTTEESIVISKLSCRVILGALLAIIYGFVIELNTTTAVLRKHQVSKNEIVMKFNVYL